MLTRVGIVDAAQFCGAESKDNFYDQAYSLTKELLDKAGISREELGTIVSAASDVFHGGISCANAYYWESVGSFLKAGTHVDAESMFALQYGAMKIMTGHFETVLLIGLCKGSENPENDSVTLYMADAPYQRPLGLNETVAAALQMSLYMKEYSISVEACASVVVKNLGNALRNPFAHRKGRYSVQDVLGSSPTAYPLRSLMCGPKSEGFIAILLASEKQTKRLTRKPVWLKGYGSSLDTYNLGDRDLLNGELPRAAKRAYAMAGISNPRKEIDLIELSEPYAFQELLWLEKLGFCDDGQATKLLDQGATSLTGELPTNPSGGVLSTNPYVSRGLARVAECVLQLRGEAGEHQVDRVVKTALAHGCTGLAGQCHAVAVLGV